jgi:hypothetical protein
MVAKVPKKREKQTFSSWYEANRVEFNRKRRSRYRKDEVYRARQLKSTRSWRKEARKVAPKATPRTYLTIGEVARQVGCDMQTLRSMEAKGLIPDSKVGLAKRKYTVKQVRLIAGVRAAMEKYHYKNPRYIEAVTRASVKARLSW